MQQGGVQPDGRAITGRLLDGRYRIEGQIARGGMAGVYEATDTRLDRRVAIKVMHAGLADDHDFAVRFVREARSAARLSHPNVVAVYDQGEDAGDVYLVMELVSGHTLRDAITKESPMTPGRALALIEPVLSALAAAHRSGVIHRDVKPENVLIADDGRVKVADFGLAKAVSADTQHTATKGVLIGTVSYLAPELVTEGSADARADVYAVGVVLYELLTGRKPHQGETPIQVAYRHVHHDVPPPSGAEPGIPDYVDALVARATARDPGLRPADAAVLLHHVHRVSHAVESGLEHDEELTLDLAPPRSSRNATIEVPTPNAGAREAGGAGEAGGERSDRRHTTPEAWDDDEVSSLRATDAEPTSLIEAGPPARPPAAPVPVKPPGHAPSSPRRKRKGLLLALALVVALAAGGGAYWLGWARYTPTPGVILLEQTAAVEKLETAGLEAGFTEPAFSETVPRGQVIESEPGPGSRVLDGGTVTLTLSKGKERYDVPKVAGLSGDEAQDALLGVKLAFDDWVERHSEKFPEGAVVRSRPAKGTTLRPGSPVDLVISLGPRPIKVGDWVGRDAGRMVAELRERGLDPNIVGREFHDTVDSGDVISHDPPGGTLNRGDEVEIVVSKGPELVEVPSVVRFGVDAAERALRDAGFDVDVQRSGDFISIGFVVRQDPGGGERAPKGSTITIWVV